MSVTITVPEKITTGFVVATDRLPDDIATAIRQCLPALFATAVLDRLGTPSLDVSEHRAADSPWDMSQVTATDEEDVKRAQRATRHIGVAAVLPAADLPRGLVLARVAAEALAASICGIPVDLGTVRVLSGNPHGHSKRFVLADDWISVSSPPHRDTGECPANPDDIDGCTCIDLQTRGLSRFGLPDLEITDVACTHGLAALNVLRTTAQRLLPLGRHPGKHVLPAEVPLTSDDFSEFWGSHGPLWDDGPLPIRLASVRSHRLSITPPEDFPGTLNEWLWDELPPVLHELLSCEPNDLHPA